MTTITVTLNRPGKLILTSTNHCQHDICVALTAFVSSIVQYAKNFESEDKCRISKLIYEYGNVELELDFKNRFLKRDFICGIDAIFTGFELYEDNFKSEVKFIKNHSPRGDI